MILSEKSVTGRSAWARLFNELDAAITVRLDDREASLEEGLSLLQAPDREVRRRAAEAVTAGLAPGIRTRAYVFNTLLADKATDDRLRHYPHWLASMNLANEASDASVQALVDAVRSRYDLPRRWYTLKAKLLGIDRLADYDRMAAVTADEGEFGWGAARSSCWTPTVRSRRSSPRSPGGSSTSRGSTHRSARANAGRVCPRTPRRRSTRISC